MSQREPALLSLPKRNSGIISRELVKLQVDAEPHADYRKIANPCEQHVKVGSWHRVNTTTGVAVLERCNQHARGAGEALRVSNLEMKWMGCHVWPTSPPVGLTGRQDGHDGRHPGAGGEERDQLEVREHRHNNDDVGEETDDPEGLGGFAAVAH